MCHFSESKAVMMIAKEDIQCFKVVKIFDGKLTGLYFRKEYSIGETYTEELDSPDIGIMRFGDGTVEYELMTSKGLHSYLGVPKFRFRLFNLKSDDGEGPEYVSQFLEISDKNGDFKDVSRIHIAPCENNLKTFRVVKCIIPKGSHYFADQKGNATSDNLKIVSAHELYEFLVKEDYI